MTVIVAARTKSQGVVLAADSQVMTGNHKHEHDTPKLWVADQYAFGSSGCLRTAQVVKHHVTWPKYRPDEDADWEKFVVAQIVPAIREGVQGRGVVQNDSGIETLTTCFLIATGDNLAAIYWRYAVVANPTGREAIGSGFAQALGALGESGPWSEADVVNAARRASETAKGVGGPISVVDTKTLTVKTAE